MKCVLCKQEVDLPYCCSYCGQYFCDDHRLPEQHLCPGLPQKSWETYKRIKLGSVVKTKPIREEPYQEHPLLPPNRKIEMPKESSGIVDKDVYIKKHKKPIVTKKKSIRGKVFLLFIIVGISCLMYVQYKPSLYDFQKIVVTTIESFSKGVQELEESVEEVNKPVDLREVELLVFNYTNIERKNQGLKELFWDEKLTLIAREHSEDMVENDFFSHTNLKGENPTDRAKRHNYKLYKPLGGGWYSEGIAENIGKMPTGNVLGLGYITDDADSIAKAQVQAWMESNGHRQNILNPNYNRIGVGVAYDGTFYVLTQNFW